MPNYPCSVCSKNVHNNRHAIWCDICDQWVHVRCNLLDTKDYTEMKNDYTKTFYFISCIKQNMPSTKLTDHDYYAAVKKGVMLSDEVIQNDTLSTVNCQDYIDKFNSYISNSTSQNGNEDHNYSPPNDCKYYTIADFTDAAFKANIVTSIFHINIHSIEKDIDELRNHLMLIDFQFDVLAISEPKLQT